MTEDEAEATMLALGPKLEWRVSSKGANANSIRSRWVDSGFYIIQGESLDGLCDQMGFRCIVFRRNGRDIIGPVLLNQDEAKAACERHFATGMWEC